MYNTLSFEYTKQSRQRRRIDPGDRSTGLNSCLKPQTDQRRTQCRETYRPDSMYDTPLKAMTHKGKVVFYDMDPFLFYSKRMLEGLRAAGFGWVASSEALVRERYAVQAIPTVDTKG